MPTNTILLTARKSKAKRFDMLRPRAVSSRAEMRASLPNAKRDTLWITDDEEMTAQLMKLVGWPSKRLGRAVLLFKPKLEAVTALQKCFSPIAFGSNGSFLPIEELAETLASKNRDELFIGGTLDKGSETVALWRGNLESMVVPFSAFPPSGDGIKPDFDKFAVTDYGQTIRFGKYEAAADAILYEYDVEYRRRKAKARLKSERTLGASIRRLRLQRGLRQIEFGRLTKTLARIERSEIQRPRSTTLAAIAKMLGVKPEEIETY